ncbi:hypothetical protein [Anaeromassilibacillus sp. SJQ-1]
MALVGQLACKNGWLKAMRCMVHQDQITGGCRPWRKSVSGVQ